MNLTFDPERGEFILRADRGDMARIFAAIHDARRYHVPSMEFAPVRRTAEDFAALYRGVTAPIQLSNGRTV